MRITVGRGVASSRRSRRCLAVRRRREVFSMFFYAVYGLSISVILKVSRDDFCSTIKIASLNSDE
jgi:hypothetical protein